MAEISTQFGRILVGGHEGKLRTFDPLISALFRLGGERNMRGVFLFFKEHMEISEREKTILQISHLSVVVLEGLVSSASICKSAKKY